MERRLPLLLFSTALCASTVVHGQRYVSEVFTNAEITITSDVIYGTNIDFLTSNFTSPDVPSEVMQLQSAVTNGDPIPPAFFDPQDASTAVKVANMRMDIYRPDEAIDDVNNRPLVIYLHTGNALPPPLNGSPTGTRKDSSAVEVCKRMARRGYVAASVSYRLGWNPLAASEEERRASLLNAIYRAIHDVRQSVRFMKDHAHEGNMYGICPDKIIVMGEGTGGYIALAHSTLDDPAELFIEKFRPDPFDPTVSYVDTVTVGNLEGFNGMLTLYRPNGYDHSTHFSVNMGGALADISWLEEGDVPMVSFHTVFDPFAPFTEGIVIVPTTGGPVVPVHGSNFFMEVVNQFGNNDAFANFPDGDPFTDRARDLYGTTQTHGSTSVTINQDVEGLFPLVTPNWPDQVPGTNEEAGPWQWWDPNSPIAQTEVAPGITAHMAASASNPNMSAAKGRAYIDTIMGYLNPRLLAALDLNAACLITGMEEENTSIGVEIYPNPAQDRITINASEAITRYSILDQQGRLIASDIANMHQIELDRGGLSSGTYFIQLETAQGRTTRKLVLH